MDGVRNKAQLFKKEAILNLPELIRKRYEVVVEMQNFQIVKLFNPI